MKNKKIILVSVSLFIVLLGAVLEFEKVTINGATKAERVEYRILKPFSEPKKPLIYLGGDFLLPHDEITAYSRYRCYGLYHTESLSRLYRK